VLPSTTKEQREPMYDDLVPLVVPGFLTTTLRIGDLTLGLRSLSTNDTGLLRQFAKENGPDWPFYLAAASIWMIDGVPLLEGYPYTFKTAFDLLKRSHLSVVRAIFAQALAFFQRMRKANLVFESFLYEEDSRRMWDSTNDGVHPIQQQAGIPGVERLGMNSFQSSWIQWNRKEDTKISDDYSWSLTKVLVSVQSGKSGKKLDEKDKTRIAGEKSRRSAVQDRAYYMWRGLVSPDGEMKDSDVPTVHQPRSAAELAEEMRRWVSGEKDFHDKVVEEYKDRVRLEMERSERDKEERAARARERATVNEQAGRPALVAYTAEQLSELRPKNAKAGAKFIVEADPVARTFNRYLRDEPDAGALAVEGGRVVNSRPLTGQEEGAPRPSLNEMIASRKPVLPNG